MYVGDRFYTTILDSEQSDECIDFTMMCVFFYFFFFFVYDDNIWSSNIASIFSNSIVYEAKVNLVGTLGGQKLKNFNIFQIRRKKTLKK